MCTEMMWKRRTSGWFKYRHVVLLHPVRFKASFNLIKGLTVRNIMKLQQSIWVQDEIKWIFPVEFNALVCSETNIKEKPSPLSISGPAYTEADLMHHQVRGITAFCYSQLILSTGHLECHLESWSQLSAIPTVQQPSLLSMAQALLLFGISVSVLEPQSYGF